MAEFFAMGGYAFAVWSSFLVAGLVYGFLFCAPIFRHRQILRDFRNELHDDDPD